MKAITKILLVSAISLIALNSFAQKKVKFKPKEIYKTSSLVITQISENAFKHVSFLQTNDFGYVPCNGLFVRNNNEIIVFDTPTNDKSAE
jgi:metallo-beta-lactamase class B